MAKCKALYLLAGVGSEQAHGLADNEKVVGVRYRRSFLNKAGLALVAEMDKRVIDHKKKGANAPIVGEKARKAD